MLQYYYWKVDTPHHTKWKIDRLVNGCLQRRFGRFLIKNSREGNLLSLQCTNMRMCGWDLADAPAKGSEMEYGHVCYGVWHQRQPYRERRVSLSYPSFLDMGGRVHCHTFLQPKTNRLCGQIAIAAEAKKKKWVVAVRQWWSLASQRRPVSLIF